MAIPLPFRNCLAWAFLLALSISAPVSSQTNVFDEASGANTYFGGFGAFNWVNSWAGFLPTAGTQLFASANGNNFAYPNIGMTKVLGGSMANQTYNVSLNMGYYYASPIIYTHFNQLYIGSGNGTMNWTTTPSPSAMNVWYMWTGTFTPAPVDIGQPFRFHMNMTLAAMHSFVMDLNFNFTLPLKVEALRAERDGQDALLSWTVADLDHEAPLEVERSINGQVFEVVGQVPVGNAPYTFRDVAVEGLKAHTFYYRVGQTDANGERYHSQVVELQWKAPAQFTAFHDPYEHALYIHNNAASTPNSPLRIVNAVGQTLWEGQAGPSMETLRIPTFGWAKGIYYLMANEPLKMMIENR